MKVLIACEYSGIVREAFKAKGWDALSADLLPTELPGEHFCGNVMEIIDQDFDLLIGHPPCTYTSSAGLYLCNVSKYGTKALERIDKRSQAVDFFLKLWNADIPHICLENPVGYINKWVLPYNQLIHPYYFGDPQLKRTALWLKNLPLLTHTQIPTLFEPQTWTQRPEPVSRQISKKTKKLKNRYFTDGIFTNKKTRAHERARTFKVIAEAMADQWTKFLA